MSNDIEDRLDNIEQRLINIEGRLNAAEYDIRREIDNRVIETNNLRESDTRLHILIFTLLTELCMELGKPASYISDIIKDAQERVRSSYYYLINNTNYDHDIEVQIVNEMEELKITMYHNYNMIFSETIQKDAWF